MPFEFHSRVPEAAAKVKAAILAAQQEVFELHIKAAAVEASPVTEEGYLHNEELGKKHPGGTGTNRRSIDVETVQTENGPQSQLFTQSGYGGYLEVGTYKMPAQPYLYPSFQDNIEKLPIAVKEKLSE